MIYRLKGSTMDGATTIFADGLKVFPRTISLVPGKIVLRVLLVVGDHQTVTGDFGHDGCCGNGKAPPIPLGNRSLSKGEAERMGAVDQKKIRRVRKILYGQLHCFQGGPEDVQTIDLRDLNDSDSCGQCLLK